ncbi:DUF2470 domain-containing protein [Blastococcus sp. MG754426]|uniref:DUF2470 domain-containing protein n=1 Tax=unclassified Blastococcus TaxID=2619396 RepID=UPI001EF07CA0|nr:MULTISPECIES: DUF2470 domain-containing protein [unclassified Blastococcus]MCF6509060.1 DUF2470 domain-containing protein [Blastococcus sp. MG754426]MCF6513678.1 DUF2470 domain-containing protein [Blastococcus sp. MG754427]
MPSSPTHPAAERRPADTGMRPEPAERARTVATRTAATICAPGVEGGRVLAHTVTRAGQVLLVVPADGDIAAAVEQAPDQDLSALLLVSDHAPVPLHRPLRAQLWLSGWATPVRPQDQRGALLAFAETRPAEVLLDVGRSARLLRLDLAEVVLGEGGEGVDVSPQDFAEARPDPLAGVEADHLRHLAGSHADVLELLAARVPAEVVGPAGVVRPLGLDRFGFRLRVERPLGHTDVRVPFARPLTCAGQLGAAVGQLLRASREARRS